MFKIILINIIISYIILSADVSGSMVPNSSCDSRPIEAVPMNSCEPGRSTDHAKVVAANSPRIETHDFNSDEQVR